MAKVQNIKVTKNNCGNFKGYVNGKMVKLFGDDSWSAIEWINETLENNPTFVLSESSYLTMKDIVARRK